MSYLLTVISGRMSANCPPQAGWALHFWLDPKTKQKDQGSLKNRLRLFAMPKCGWVIFEQSSQLPSLTKALLQSTTYFSGGQWPQCKGISIGFSI